MTYRDPRDDSPPPEDQESATMMPAPPSHIEAEESLMGVILAKGSAFHEVGDMLEERHFVEEAYAALWRCMQKLADKSIVISPVSMVDAATAALQWERKEVAKLLVTLMTRVPLVRDYQAKHYAWLIKDAWVRRKLFEAAQVIKDHTRKKSDATGAEILEEVESKIFAISAESSSDDHAVNFSDALGEAVRQAQAAATAYEDGKMPGVPTGLGAIDRKLGGFRNPDFIVVGAATGMGKTAFLCAVAVAAARFFVSENPDKPKWVYIFSLEMSADQLALRMAASEARISFERIRLGHASPEDLQKLEEASQRLRDLPIRIDDTPGITVPAMRARLRRWKRKHGLGLGALDYLQLVGSTAEEQQRTRGNRVQEMSLITRNCKTGIAKGLDIPLLALAQLSRELEKREDKRPQMSDLRESGTIEQDADVVGFIYREVYYLKRRPPQKKDRESEIDYGTRRTDWSVAVDKLEDHAEFIIAKNRHGSTGAPALKFVPELMLFEDDTPGDATQGGARKVQLAMDLMVE